MRSSNVILILTIIRFFVLTKQQDFDFDIDEVNEYLDEDENGTLYQQFPISTRMSFSPSKDEITLHVYTINNRDKEIEIRTTDLEEIKECPVFNKRRDNLFIIHGYLSDPKSDLNIFIKNAIFKANLDVNVFCVDWSRAAGSLWYPRSARAIKFVGDHLGNFVNDMMKYFNLTSSKFKFVGHSLGAHVAGRIGFKMTEKPDYIIGMDPAGPNFSKKPNEVRLDKSDATFVQVIHTNSALYGISNATGHADYYPNSGYRQPGCFLNTCSHSRSWEYFAESIERGGFKAKRCSNYNWYNAGSCQFNGDSFMGNYKIDKSARGVYYLHTNKNSPFSKGG